MINAAMHKREDVGFNKLDSTKMLPVANGRTTEHESFSSTFDSAMRVSMHFVFYPDLTIP
jgi:hypothetical protein